MSPPHVSAYALTVEPGTPLAADTARHPDEDVQASRYLIAEEVLGAAGLRNYEISNWARPGHESRHNLAYWRRLSYEAVGPGAHAFDGAVRRWNAARLDGYLTPLSGSSPALPPGGVDTLTPAEAAAEAAILALRLDTGLALPGASGAASPLAPHLDWALERGLLERLIQDGEERVRLTTAGRLLSNELFARLV